MNEKSMPATSKKIGRAMAAALGVDDHRFTAVSVWIDSPEDALRFRVEGFLTVEQEKRFFATQEED